MVKKECSKHQIRNPQTGRCVKLTGKIGQSLIESMQKNMSEEKVMQATSDAINDYKKLGKSKSRSRKVKPVPALSETMIPVVSANAPVKVEKELIEKPELAKHVLEACDEVVVRLEKVDFRLFAFLQVWCKGITSILGNVLGKTFNYAPYIAFALVSLHLYLHAYLEQTTLRNLQYLLSPLDGYWNGTDYLSLILMSLVENKYPRIAKIIGSVIIVKWMLPIIVRSIFLAFLQWGELTA